MDWMNNDSASNSVRTDLGFRKVRPRGCNVGEWFRGSSAFRSSNCSISGVYCPSLGRDGDTICRI